MSADLAVTPILRSNNPFEAARLKLIASLLAMKAPAAYPSFPVPSDHAGVADHLREAAIIFDEWLATVGHQIRDNASNDVDERVFEGAFTGAIEGNATWEVEKAAETLLDERNAMRRAS